MTDPVHYHEGKFPPSDLDWRRLIPLLGPASAAVARYDGTLSAIPNASVLLSPLTTQEAVLSSRIEGTQATMGEVLEYEARGDTSDSGSEREADIWEVLNYRKAMRAAVDMLKEMPLCQRIIREAHKILLNSEFFLKAVQIQAEENLQKTNTILALYNQMKSQIAELTRSQYAIHALDWIFDRPVFKSSDFVRNAGIPDPTAKRILGILKNESVLKTLHEGSGRRAAVLAFTELLNIAEGKEVF